MENQTKLNAAILSLLVILTTYTIVGENDPTHYSESLQVKIYCDRLSSSNKTCYPTTGTTIGKKYSREGWKVIPFMPEEVPINSPNHKGKREICNIDGCEEQT